MEVWGPPQRGAEVALELYEKGTVAPRVARSIPLTLPITREDWDKKIVAVLRRDRAVAEWYDQASRGVLRIAASEAGNAALSLERESKALRWATRRAGDAIALRLVDEDDRPRTLQVLEYTFQEPDIARSHDANVLRQGLAFPRGGLVHFQAEDVAAGMVVAPAVRTFTDLTLTPRLCNHDRSPIALLNLCHLADRWSSARTTGHLLASTFRAKVVGALQQDIFRIIGGARWEAAERKVLDGAAVDEAVSLVGTRHESAAAHAIQRDRRQFAASTPYECVTRLVHLLKPFCAALPNDPGLPFLVETALRLASNPAGISRFLTGRWNTTAAALLGQPLLARACRLVVLATQDCRVALSWDWR